MLSDQFYNFLKIKQNLHKNIFSSKQIISRSKFVWQSWRQETFPPSYLRSGLQIPWLSFSFIGTSTEDVCLHLTDRFHLVNSLEVETHVCTSFIDKVQYVTTMNFHTEQSCQEGFVSRKKGFALLCFFKEKFNLAKRKLHSKLNKHPLREGMRER